MKKLNRKGFTLIELLAVIVILAIIVVVTVPTILGSINDARISTLHSLSKEVANWFDNGSAQDLMAIGNDRILYGADSKVTTDWKCINSVMTTSYDSDKDGDVDQNDEQVSLATLYNLSGTDINLDSSEPNDDLTFKDGNVVAGNLDVISSSCSAIRKRNNGSVEVLLIAKPNGKFATGTTTYALSSASNGSNEVAK